MAGARRAPPGGHHGRQLRHWQGLGARVPQASGAGALGGKGRAGLGPSWVLEAEPGDVGAEPLAGGRQAGCDGHVPCPACCRSGDRVLVTSRSEAGAQLAAQQLRLEAGPGADVQGAGQRTLVPVPRCMPDMVQLAPCGLHNAGHAPCLGGAVLTDGMRVPRQGLLPGGSVASRPACRSLAMSVLQARPATWATPPLWRRSWRLPRGCWAASTCWVRCACCPALPCLLCQPMAHMHGHASLAARHVLPAMAGAPGCLLHHATCPSREEVKESGGSDLAAG